MSHTSGENVEKLLTQSVEQDAMKNVKRLTRWLHRIVFTTSHSTTSVGSECNGQQDWSVRCWLFISWQRCTEHSQTQTLPQLDFGLVVVNAFMKEYDGQWRIGNQDAKRRSTYNNMLHKLRSMMMRMEVFDARRILKWDDKPAVNQNAMPATWCRGPNLVL